MLSVWDFCGWFFRGYCSHAAWWHTSKSTWPDLFACDRAVRPVPTASCTVISHSGEQLHLLSPINVQSEAQTGHLRDEAPRRSWLKAVTVQQISSESSRTLKEIGRDTECGGLTSRQHPRCCHCERSHRLWEVACASVCTRFQCGHSESDEPKGKERGSLLHLRSFLPLCAAWRFFVSFLCPCMAI